MGEIAFFVWIGFLFTLVVYEVTKSLRIMNKTSHQAKATIYRLPEKSISWNELFQLLSFVRSKHINDDFMMYCVGRIKVPEEVSNETDTS